MVAQSEAQVCMTQSLLCLCVHGATVSGAGRDCALPRIEPGALWQSRYSGPLSCRCGREGSSVPTLCLEADASWLLLLVTWTVCSGGGGSSKEVTERIFTHNLRLLLEPF